MLFRSRTWPVEHKAVSRSEERRVGKECRSRWSPYVRVTCYVQERKYSHVYVHTGGVSNAYSRIRTARARVHGWVRTETQHRRRVHGDGGTNRLGQNEMRRRVHRDGLDGTADGNEAWRTAEWRKRLCVRPATVEMGSCSSGGVWRTAKRRKRTSKRGSC